MDPYVYPNTNVLKNLKDLRDIESLTAFEASATSWRIAQLLRKRKPGKFDITHLHFRTVNIARPAQFFFAYMEQINFTLTTMTDALRKEQYLSGLGPERFAQRAAYYMGELNAIHPFRDGNGRTQREFIRQLGRHDGIALHWSRITREQMGAASKRSFEKADNPGLAEVILSSIHTQ